MLVALAMTPIAGMTLVNTLQEYRNAIHIAEENLLRLTRLAAANEAQSVAGARQILVDISSFPDLLDDNARCAEMLRNILRHNKSYANFGVIQMNGDVTCSAVASSAPVNLGDRPHFKRAVEELPENFRIPVLLADLEGFSYKEIAEILDIPIGTVMSRLHRGRKSLQKKLFEYATERGLAPAGVAPQTD